MQNIADIIKELNKKIKNHYINFKGIYVYGSFAQGKNIAGSDLDIVALFQNPLLLNERMQLWELISELEVKYGIMFDLHPMSDKELEKNPIYFNQVVNKGIFYGV